MSIPKGHWSIMYGTLSIDIILYYDQQILLEIEDWRAFCSLIFFVFMTAFSIMEFKCFDSLFSFMRSRTSDKDDCEEYESMEVEEDRWKMKDIFNPIYYNHLSKRQHNNHMNNMNQKLKIEIVLYAFQDTFTSTWRKDTE